MYEVDFLPADKHESFPQIDSITLGVGSQASSEYREQQIYNNFAISQGKREGWIWFADKRQGFFKLILSF